MPCFGRSSFIVWRDKDKQIAVILGMYLEIKFLCVSLQPYNEKEVIRV
jgi:hypothetical protein